MLTAADEGDGAAQGRSQDSVNGVLNLSNTGV